MLDFRFLQKILPRVYSFLPFVLRPETSFPPAQAFFEVTYRCNLRCEMCHYLEIIDDTEKNRKYQNELSSDEVKKALDALPGFTLITFTGGEAFMKSDFQEILEHAAAGHKVHIITNGTLLSESMVEKLLTMRTRSVFGKGVFYIGVSLEGHEALHDRITLVPGSFRKTTKGLERLVTRRLELKSRFPLVHLTCVIKRENVMDLNPIYDYANDLGVNVCNFVLENPATYWHAKDYNQDIHLKLPAPKVKEIRPDLLRAELKRLEEKSRSYRTKLRFSPNDISVEEIVRYYSNLSSYKDYRCFVPWSKVAFTAYGDVFSCPHYRLGSVDPDTGDLAWQGDRAQEFRKRLKKERIFPGCLGCCQSEYIGPKNDTRLPVEGKKEFRFKKPQLNKDFVIEPNIHVHDRSG